MEYLWTPQPKGKFLFEWAVFFITRNRRQVQFLSFWFIGAFIAEHNHLSQMHFSSSRWPFGPFGRTVYLGLSCGLCTKSCTKCRKRDRIIHNLMKRQFAVYRSIAPMMNQDITIKWANRASPHDEAHWPVIYRKYFVNTSNAKCEICKNSCVTLDLTSIWQHIHGESRFVMKRDECQQKYELGFA